MKMRALRSRWLPCAALCLALPGCFITNNLNIQPPGAWSGLELKNALAERGALNFWLGVATYCEQFSHAAACRDAAQEEALRGATMAYFALPAKVAELENFSDHDFFTGQSAEECVGKAGTGMVLATNVMITNNATKDTNDSIIDESIRKGVQLAAPVAPIVAAHNCVDILETPGPLLYFGRTDKIFPEDGDDEDSGDDEGSE